MPPSESWSSAPGGIRSVAMNPKTAAAVAVWLGIVFALTIAPWGGWRAFFAHPAFLALTLLTVLLTLVVIPSGSSGLSSGQREDRSNRWVLGAFAGIAVLLIFFSSYTDRIGFWTIDGETVRWVGVALGAMGGVLRIVPIYVLKKRFSGLVAIQPEHRLETTGIYGVIRHPSYLGALISSLGWAFTFRSVVGLLLAASLLVPFVARIRAEERMLRQHFGEEYASYCARTWRLIPGIY